MKPSEQPISKETIDELAATPLVIIARRIAHLESQNDTLLEDLDSLTDALSAEMAEEIATRFGNVELNGTEHLIDAALAYADALAAIQQAKEK